MQRAWSMSSDPKNRPGWKWTTAPVLRPAARRPGGWHRPLRDDDPGVVRRDGHSRPARPDGRDVAQIERRQQFDDTCKLAVHPKRYSITGAFGRSRAPATF